MVTRGNFIHSGFYNVSGMCCSNSGESRGIMGNREESRGISLGVTGNIGESRGMLRNYGEYRRESWGIPWNIAGNRGERGVITWKIEDTSSFPRIKA